MSARLQIIVSALVAVCLEQGYILTTSVINNYINEIVTSLNLQENPEKVRRLILTLVNAKRVYDAKQHGQISGLVLLDNVYHPIRTFINLPT